MIIATNAGFSTNMIFSGVGSYNGHGAVLSNTFSPSQITFQGTQSFALDNSGTKPFTANAMAVELLNSTDSLIVTGGNLILLTPNVVNNGNISTLNTIGIMPSTGPLSVSGSGTMTAAALNLTTNPGPAPAISFNQNTLNGILPSLMTITASSPTSISITALGGAWQVGSMAATNGSISITKSGSLQVVGGVLGSPTTLSAGGSLSLLTSSTGSIVLGSFNAIAAKGSVTMSIGNVQQVPGVPNPNINISGAQGTIYWSSASVNANPNSGSSIVSNSGTTMTFSQSGSTSAITLQGNDTITIN